MPPLPASVGAYEQARLEQLAQRRNTTVLQVEYDDVRDPWPVARVRAVLDTIAARVAREFADETVADFTVRKTLVDSDPEIRAFYRGHQQLFQLATDRAMLRDERFRNAVAALLQVRTLVERGDLAEGQDADALATRSVLSAFGTQHVNDAAAAASAYQPPPPPSTPP